MNNSVAQIRILVLLDSSNYETIKNGDFFKSANDEYSFESLTGFIRWLDNTKEEHKAFKLLFNNYSTFKSNIKFLEILDKENVDIEVNELPLITKSTLPALLQVIKYESNAQSKKIREGIKRKISNGGEFGNKNIGKKKSKAQRSRILKSLTDRENIEVRRMIREQVEDNNNHNFSDIARFLNSGEHTTIRGKSFHAKSISRLYADVTALSKHFGEGFAKAPVENKEAEQKQKITDLRKDTNFETNIEFNIIKKNIKDNIKVTLHDYDRSEVVFEKIYDKDTVRIKIGLDEEILLPGLHYLTISSFINEFESITIPIRLRSSILKKLGIK